MDELPDPCSCQSRKRRQQVIPEPQPSSCGSISQGFRFVTGIQFPPDMPGLQNAAYRSWALLSR